MRLTLSLVGECEAGAVRLLNALLNLLGLAGADLGLLVQCCLQRRQVGGRVSGLVCVEQQQPRIALGGLLRKA